MLSAGLIILPPTAWLGEDSAIRLGRAELPCTCPCVMAPAQLLPEVPQSLMWQETYLPCPWWQCWELPTPKLAGEEEMLSWSEMVWEPLGCTRARASRWTLIAFSCNFNLTWNAPGVVKWKPRAVYVGRGSWRWSGPALLPFNRVTQIRLPKTMSSWDLSIFKDRPSTTSAENLFPCSATLAERKCLSSFN